jgi:hypothetical protein
VRRDTAHDAAHGAQAAVARRRIAGTQRAADRRPESVGADQHVAAFAPSIGEDQLHVVAVQLESGPGAAEREIIGRSRVEQRAVDSLAQRHQRRRRRVERPDVEALQRTPVQASQLDRLRPMRFRLDASGDAERPQRGHRVRRQVEREAELARSGGALEDAGAPAHAAQRDAGREAADAGADDQRGPHRSRIDRGPVIAETGPVARPASARRPRPAAPRRSRAAAGGPRSARRPFRRGRPASSPAAAGRR